MGANKFEYFGTVKFDLTGDTIVPEKLAYGYTAHDASGEQITGTLKTVPLDPIEYDYNIGYITNGAWVYEKPTQTYTDFYNAISGHRYIISLGANVGSRFRSMFTTTDVRTVTSGRVTGVKIVDKNNPQAYDMISYSATDDGYILVAKDNVGKTGVFSYVIDVTDAFV